MSRFNCTNKAEKSKSLPIFVGGKVVGQVRNGTFYKTLAPQHFLKVPPAIAFSTESLKQAERAGAVRVEVKNRETGTIYRATMAKIWEEGFSVNRGYEPQIALPLEKWQVETKGEPAQPSQMALFGV